jgi:DNA-directed RNA polymerase specialized sigma24 family protein
MVAPPESKTDCTDVFAALGRLSPVLRDAFLARDVIGLTNAEAATVLLSTPARIDGRVKRARRELKQQPAVGSRCSNCSGKHDSLCCPADSSRRDRF